VTFAEATTWPDTVATVAFCALIGFIFWLMSK
jgi:hypothetical protein